MHQWLCPLRALHAASLHCNPWIEQFTCVVMASANMCPTSSGAVVSDSLMSSTAQNSSQPQATQHCAQSLMYDQLQPTKKKVYLLSYLCAVGCHRRLCVSPCPLQQHRPACAATFTCQLRLPHSALLSGQVNHTTHKEHCYCTPVQCAAR